jgi:hypothetical protein
LTLANPHHPQPLTVPIDVQAGRTLHVRETIPGFDYEPLLSKVAP